MRSKAKRPEQIADVIAWRRERIAVRRDCALLLLRVLAVAVAGYALFTQVFLIAQVGGMGMFPALKDGDLAIVFRMQRTYARDDVIAYRADGQRRFGRIVAREADVVAMDGSGTLLVNGTPQAGEILYPTCAKAGVQYPCRVPEGCVFVLGDYRTQAQDSRDFGPIPLGDVEGKLITILRRRGL